jgi:hypothetical protein
MELRIPTPLLAVAAIIFFLSLSSCNTDEDIAAPTRGKLAEISGSPIQDPSHPTPKKAIPPGRVDRTDDARHIVLQDRFGFQFRLNILNRSPGYDIYEGESIDPRGNRYAAGGIYSKVDGELSLSSFIQGNIPYYNNLKKASSADYRGYEQLLGNPWEHYHNTYLIIEGRLE